MSGLPVPYPAVGRLMDAGIPAVINSTSRVVLNRSIPSPRATGLGDRYLPFDYLY